MADDEVREDEVREDTRTDEVQETREAVANEADPSEVGAAGNDRATFPDQPAPGDIDDEGNGEGRSFDRSDAGDAAAPGAPSPEEQEGVNPAAGNVPKGEEAGGSPQPEQPVPGV